MLLNRYKINGNVLIKVFHIKCQILVMIKKKKTLVTKLFYNCN